MSKLVGTLYRKVTLEKKEVNAYKTEEVFVDGKRELITNKIKIPGTEYSEKFMFKSANPEIIADLNDSSPELLTAYLTHTYNEKISFDTIPIEHIRFELDETENTKVYYQAIEEIILGYMTENINRTRIKEPSETNLKELESLLEKTMLEKTVIELKDRTKIREILLKITAA